MPAAFGTLKFVPPKYRMQTLRVLSILLFVSISAVGIMAQGGERSVKNEILVKFKPNATRDSERKLLSRTGGTVLEKFADIGWQRIRLPKGMNVDAAIAGFKADDSVEIAQPNFYYHLLATPNDPNFGSMYGMAKISAPAAWDITTGSSAVVVADIDTGIKYTHEDLAANMWTNSGEIPNNGIDDDGNGFIDDYYGYDFFFNDPDPMDEHGHGTHTAGTIGAVGNNSLGVVGVAWNVRIMAIKIYNSSGFGTTSAMLINAYNYVRMMKNRGVNIRVTNNSYGGCDEACGYDQATKDAIDALGNAGVLQVFAAGNDGRDIDAEPSFPASYTSPTIISVANSNQSDNRSLSSNFGVNSVDLAAPGTSILSTVISAANYGTLSGTSMATPHVAGAAVLLAAQFPTLSPVSIKATLLNNVDQLSQWNGVVRSGGRLNAAAALQNPTTCSFNLASGSLNAPTKGGVFTLNVTAPQNCDFTVKSNAKWISILGADSVSGNTALTFRVAVNTAITRSATVTVAGQEFTVNQSRTGTF